MFRSVLPEESKFCVGISIRPQLIVFLRLCSIGSEVSIHYLL